MSEDVDGAWLAGANTGIGDNTNEGIVQTIKEWRIANGLPGFKPDN